MEGDIFPMEFPTATSTHRYLRSIHRGDVVCDDSSYNTGPSNLVKMKGTPGLRTSCHVFIYIAPLRCTRWQLAIVNANANISRLIPEEIVNMGGSMAHVTAIEPAFRNIQSGQFTILVGQMWMGLMRVQLNLFTKFELYDASLESVALRTKLFIMLGRKQDGSSQILGMFWVAPLVYGEAIKASDAIGSPSGYNDTITRVVNVMLRRYQLRALPKVGSTTELEKSYFTKVQKSGMSWIQSCNHCVAKNDFLSKNQQIMCRNWRGEPEVEHIIFNLLFPNSTIISETSFILLPAVRFNPILSRKLYPINATLLFVPFAEHDGYHFFTCSGILELETFSLLGFISAYDYPTWICIIGSFILLPMHLLRNVLQMRLVDVVLNAASILLEQGSRGNVWKRSKCICGVWLMMAIILSNLYKGDNITTLTAPLSKPKLETFDQLIRHNFTYFVSFQSANVIFDLVDMYLSGTNLGIKIEGGSKKLTYDDVNGDIIGAQNNDSLQAIQDNVLDELSGGVGGTLNGIVTAVFSRINWPGSTEILRNWTDPYAILPLLEDCEKQAYLGHRRQVMTMSQVLTTRLLKHKSKHVVSVSKESFSKVGKTWNLKYAPIPASHLFRLVHSLWESGLVELWDEWSLRVETWNTTRENEIASFQAKLPNKMNLADNVAVEFFMYLILIFVCFLVFYKEVQLNIIRRAMKTIQNMVSCTCNASEVTLSCKFECCKNKSFKIQAN